MGRVRILPPDVAGKIAAGEVVERPASAVKELVENSLDAGATRVRIEIEEGGKRRIRVEDDGCGMNREDAVICFERHATSKLAAAADLLSVRTRGFRGEALPSIAEVSRLQLWTNDLSTDCGTYLRIHGGVKEKIEDAALPRGTIVEVEELFFNFPAREKFLKSAAGEAGHVSRMVDLLGLSSHSVGFTLRSAGRRVAHWEAVPARLSRIRQVLGDHLDLLEFDETDGPFRWNGFVTPPLERSVERAVQHFFVNGRPIRDRTLAYALRRGYQEYLQRETNPTAVVYLEIDPAIVDVNVHPAKTEIRFLESSDLFRSLLGAVKRRLGKLQTFSSVHLDGAPIAPAAFAAGHPPGTVARSGEFISQAPGPLPIDPAREAQLPLAAPSSLRDTPFLVLGQYRDSFIVVTMRDALLVIDQHNAHERALYEDFCARSGPVESQRYLLPPVMDLSEGAFRMVLEHAPDLLRHGLRVEEAGPHSIAIREAPAALGEAGAAAFLGELLEEAEGGRDLRAFLDFHLLRSLACHSAVKINTPLTIEKMGSIVANLFATSTPMVCPHGRPIIVRLRLEEILRGLRRNLQGFE